MPLFSIIIPTYNRCGLFARALDSVLKQTISDYELIIVDDGSTDDTRQIDYEHKDRLKYVYQINSGVSSARNTGIKNSNSPYIFF